MGVLTPRERQILTLLREGSRVRDIAKRFHVSPTSISRSISNIRKKARDVEEEVRFLCRVGYLTIKNGNLVNTTRDGDPKSIARPLREGSVGGEPPGRLRPPPPSPFRSNSSGGVVSRLPTPRRLKKSR